jgi:xylulokinase
MLPWFVPEITPAIDHAGVHRRGFDAAEAGRNIRAIVEAQAMAMRLHSRWIAAGVAEVRATGGGAANAAILQVIADVFGADVVRPPVTNTAALGAALRAFHGDAAGTREERPWSTVVAGFTDPDPALRVRPDRAAAAVYAKLLPEYEEFESRMRSSA